MPLLIGLFDIALFLLLRAAFDLDAIIALLGYMFGEKEQFLLSNSLSVRIYSRDASLRCLSSSSFLYLFSK